MPSQVSHKKFICSLEMRVMIKSLLNSLPDFGNIGVFMAFVFILFATMGIQQYSVQFYNMCRLEDLPNNITNSWPSDITINRPCSTNELGTYSCPNSMVCGNIQDYPEIAIETENFDTKEYLNYGITTFSHLGTSLLTIFQIITSETWMQHMFNMMDVDVPIIGALFCFSLIIIGQIFLLNLILAVIIKAFMTSQQK